jgi:hypothetical protein
MEANPMAKAKRVHSTPRRTASKIQAKKPAKPAKPAESDEQRNLRHAKAFRNFEGPFFQVFCMSQITSTLLDPIQDELAVFAVSRLCDMISDLHDKYTADSRGLVPRGKAVA